MPSLTTPSPYPNPAQNRLAATIRPLDPSQITPAPPADRPALGQRVAIVGLADDTGVRLNQGRPGARDGPRAFRAALAKYGLARPMDFPARGLSFPEVYDVGDVLPGESLAQTHDRVTSVALTLLKGGYLPVGIGGGHDLTFPLVRALMLYHSEHDQNRWPAPNGVYVDPHLDVRPEPGSGMAFRAILEHTGVRALTNVGANPLVNTPEHLNWFTAHGGLVLPASAIDDGDELDRILDEAWFVSLDLDALDASVAPGVSALNPEGLSSAALAKVAHRAGASLWVGCFDLMELNPAHDADGRTARVAAHLFLSFLRGVAERLTGPGIDWP